MDAPADPENALDMLEDRCRHRSRAVLDGLLARLRTRPHEVARALKGHPLYVRIVLADPGVEGWVVFTREGHVAVVGDDAVRPQRRSPDLLVQGPARPVLAALLGVTEARAALDAGVLIPMVPTDHLEALLSLVRRELLAVAAGYTEA